MSAPIFYVGKKLEENPLVFISQTSFGEVIISDNSIILEKSLVVTQRTIGNVDV